MTIADTDNPDNSAVAASRAVMADAEIHVRGMDVTTPASFSGAVATLEDEGDGPVSDFSAAIAWGDGARSAGIVTQALDGTFVVSGTHSYPRSGRYDAKVSVESVGGSDDRDWTDVLVYDFATSGGASFAIGDTRAAIGTPVTFWGSRWSRQNPLASGVAVDASYKGFVTAQSGHPSPRCADTWTTSASAVPPSDVPAYMGVVVASKVTKSGSTFSGDVKKVVVVKTDGGYGSTSSGSGTGKVVAVVCE